MVSSRTKILLLGATFLGGLLAGGNIDRLFVAMPAWRQVGAMAWATFSQKADLGNGLLLYPFEAIGAALLNIGAVISFRFDWKNFSSAGFPLYAAAFLAICGLLVTIKAAPIMLSVPRLSDDPLAIQKAFDGFNFWGGLRGLFQVSAFVANLWAWAILRREK